MEIEERKEYLKSLGLLSPSQVQRISASHDGSRALWEESLASRENSAFDESDDFNHYIHENEIFIDFDLFEKFRKLDVIMRRCLVRRRDYIRHSFIEGNSLAQRDFTEQVSPLTDELGREIREKFFNLSHRS